MKVAEVTHDVEICFQNLDFPVFFRISLTNYPLTNLDCIQKAGYDGRLRFRRFIHIFVFLGTNRKLLVNYAWKTKGKKPFSRKQIFGFPEWPTIISLDSGPYMNAIKLVFLGKLSVFRLDQFYFEGLWCSCFRIDTVWNNCGLYIWLGALSPCLKLVSSRNER